MTEQLGLRAAAPGARPGAAPGAAPTGPQRQFVLPLSDPACDTAINNILSGGGGRAGRAGRGGGGAGAARVAVPQTLTLPKPWIPFPNPTQTFNPTPNPPNHTQTHPPDLQRDTYP